MSTSRTCIHLPSMSPHLGFMLLVALQNPSLPLIQYSLIVPLVIHLYISLQEVAGLASIIPSAMSVQAIPSLNTNSRNRADKYCLHVITIKISTTKCYLVSASDTNCQFGHYVLPQFIYIDLYQNLINAYFITIPCRLRMPVQEALHV